MAEDDIVGVRVGVARLVGTLCGTSWTLDHANIRPDDDADVFLRQSQPVTGVILDLIRHLCLDSSRDVRSYVPDLIEGRESFLNSSTILLGHYGSFPASSAISRPPPLPVSASPGRDGHSIAVTQADPADHGIDWALRDGTRRSEGTWDGRVRQRYMDFESHRVVSDISVGQQVRVPV